MELVSSHSEWESLLRSSCFRGLDKSGHAGVVKGKAIGDSKVTSAQGLSKVGCFIDWSEGLFER